jgi:hypothetical protein
MKTESEILKEAADRAEILDIVNRDVFNRIFSAFGHERPFPQNPQTYDDLCKPIIGE